MTKRQITKQAMIQVIITEELNAWNSLMFDNWYYGSDSREAYGSRNAWSVLSTTLSNIGVAEYQGAKRRTTIDIPRPVIE
jgi:hypothetical protein